jgi:transposase InsO family protein
MSRETSAGVATVTQLCEAFGISRAAYYAAKKPRPAAKVIAIRRAPRHTSSEVALDAIREVIAAEPAWGVRKVWATLKRTGLKVSRKRVHALMRANGLVLARDREPGETTRGHVAVPMPNRRFGGDLTTVWTKKDGWVAVVPTIDCGCRSVLGLTVTKDQHSPAVLASIEQALEEAFGEPKNVPSGVELRTDHGSQYTGADCAAFVAKWNLLHTFAPVGRPTGNAVAERVIRTMKEEVVWLRDWDTADELRAALLAWQIRYNSQRPHQALGWKTPAEHRAEKLGLGVEKAA